MAFRRTAGLTNAEAAKVDPEFLRDCKLTGVEPTRQTYRQYKSGRGRVHKLLRAIDTSHGKTVLG